MREALAQLFCSGVALIEEQQFAEALPVWEQVCTLAPDDPIAWLNCGVVLCQLARFAEALAAFEAGLRGAASPSIRMVLLLNRGTVFLEELHQPAAALVAFEAALSFGQEPGADSDETNEAILQQAEAFRKRALAAKGCAARPA